MQKQQQQFLQVQVKRTTTELENQAKKYGEDSRQAQNLRSKLLDLQLQQEKVNKTIKDAPQQIFRQQTAEIGGKIKNVGIGMAAAVTAPIVGAGVGIYKTGEMYQQAYNKIRVGTGAKDSAFDGLKDSFKNVYAQVASSSDLVAVAIADLNTRVGVTGEALEKLAVQELRFSKLTNTDLKETIKGSTRMFGDWGIPITEQTKTLDKLYKVTQLTGVSSQQLMEQLVFFGAPLRSMGINFGEAAALIGKFEKEGVNAELVLTSMRRAAVNMSKAGVTDISGGFAGAIQNIKNAKTDADAMNTAIDIFGARSANDMMRAIRENRFELGELFKALNDNSDSLGLAATDTATYGSKMEKLKHQIDGAWSWLSDTLPQYMNYIGGKISAWDSDMYAGLAKGMKNMARFLNKMGITVNPNILNMDAGNIASMQLSNDPVITRQTVNQTIKIDIHGKVDNCGQLGTDGEPI